MLRFPNPGSDIRGLIRLFQSLFLDLASDKSFSLDDMSKAMVLRNLAASCGRMGSEALERSTRDDRSCDPLYNQSKMYSELFRALGWITSASDSRLSFYFTTLGAHVASAGPSAEKLTLSCIVGIAFPNPVLDIKFETSVRPFSCILKAMKALDGYICRDEIILGPMSIKDDRDPRVFAKMIADIKGYRKSRNLTTPLNALLKKCQISKTTSENYTRFPLAVLKWSAWATTSDKKIYDGRFQKFYELTAAGETFVERCEKMHDFRASDIDNYQPEVIKALIENTYYAMLASADFDLAPVAQIIATNDGILRNHNISIENLIFSPFQELSQKQFEEFTDIPVIYSDRSQQTVSAIGEALSGNSSARTSVHHKIQLLKGSNNAVTNQELREIWKQANANIEDAVRKLISRHQNDNKEDFYPLVASLFTAAGFPCETSRTGVNYQRWDASIELNGLFIPIEIKSPGEEKQLSVKAIRQALENHVILQARLSEKSKKEYTSLAVGFQYPNDRAEVNELVANIRETFDIKIGVIDFASLVQIAFCNAFASGRLSTSDLENLYGFLDINS